MMMQYTSQSFYGHRPRGPSLGALVLMMAGVAGLTWVFVTQFQSQSQRRVAADPRPVVARGELGAEEMQNIEVFEAVSSSVVYISPRTLQRDFWTRNIMEVPAGTGSGFIWDNLGHVVTNFHVIQGASSASVTMHDGHSYEADLVGALPDKDLAVLRIDAPEDTLIPVMVGTSHDLRVGQKVFAIGNPFGLDYSLTTGIVSAVNREIMSVNRRTISGVIQTDAAINPGNSGGPLLDSAGRLIGMNTAIYSRTGESAGIGFAVPVDTINDIVPELIANGRITRPGLGVVPYPDEVAERNRINGVVIRYIEEGSAADRAGLIGPRELGNGRTIAGDIIVEVDDDPTPNADALLTALEKHEVGDTVTLRVRRDDQLRTVEVTLQALR